MKQGLAAFGPGSCSTAPREEAEMKEDNMRAAMVFIYGGYRPGVIGKITEIHGSCCAENWTGCCPKALEQDSSCENDCTRPAASCGDRGRIPPGCATMFGSFLTGKPREAAQGFNARAIVFNGLDGTRSLYESEGFQLTEEHDVRQWGNGSTEQMFLLDLAA
jgi:hypothetical protein